MATKVIMPKAGMAMEEGVLVAWLKKVGDEVKSGEAIAEIETDKAIMDLEAELDGTLIAIVRQAGEHVPVTQTIAWIGKAGESVPAARAMAVVPATGGSAPKAALPEVVAPAASSDGRVAATPAARRLASEAGMELASIPSSLGSPINAEDVLRHVRSDATPLASRMAQAAGLDPASLVRGDGSRARSADAAAAMAKAPQASPSRPTATYQPPTGLPREDRRLAFTAIQRITGERLTRSHAEIPSVSIFTVADATELLAARERINAAGSLSGNLKVSLNDLVVRACAKALLANPRANAVVDGDGLILKGGIHIGLAVATDAGLQVPTLRDADRLSLPEQALRSKDLAERARARRLRPDELEGGTFTISNIGMYGITSFTPIINQPQVGILGVGALEERLVLGAGGQPVQRRMLHLSFTFDHRAMDGVESSAFLVSVKDLVEAPLILIL
ncbi:MAG: dihydrolipoamide acetyltransferase family protein [Spirochaetota bacterium]